MALEKILSLPCIMADSLAAAARVGDEAWLSCTDGLFSARRRWGQPAEEEGEEGREEEGVCVCVCVCGGGVEEGSGWGVFVGDFSAMHLVSTATLNNFSQTREMTSTS